MSLGGAAARVAMTVCACALVAAFCAGGASAASSYRYGLLVGNATTESVSVALGGGSTCLRGSGSGRAAVAPGADTALTLRLDQRIGPCAPRAWQLPFSIAVGGVAYPFSLAHASGLDCDGNTLDTLDTAGGVLGVAGMACYRGQVTGALPPATRVILAPNPLVLFGRGFDIVFNAAGPGGANCTSSAWQSCVDVMVTPTTPALSRAIATPRLTYLPPAPRAEIFASGPRLGGVVAARRDGRLTFRSAIAGGAAAPAVTARAGSVGVVSEVTLAAALSARGHALGTATNRTLLSPTGQHARIAFALSATRTARLCRSLRQLGTSTAAVTMYLRQRILEPGHAYEIVVRRELSARPC